MQGKQGKAANWANRDSQLAKGTRVRTLEETKIAGNVQNWKRTQSDFLGLATCDFLFSDVGVIAYSAYSISNVCSHALISVTFNRTFLELEPERIIK